MVLDLAYTARLFDWVFFTTLVIWSSFEESGILPNG